MLFVETIFKGKQDKVNILGAPKAVYNQQHNYIIINANNKDKSLHEQSIPLQLLEFP